MPLEVKVRFVDNELATFYCETWRRDSGMIVLIDSQRDMPLVQQNVQIYISQTAIKTMTIKIAEEPSSAGQATQNLQLPKDYQEL